MLKKLAAFVAVAVLAASAFAEVTIKPGHPKVMLTGADIARAKKNIEAGGANWRVLKSRIDDGSAPVAAYGIVYLATGDEAIGRRGVQKLMASDDVEQVALGYDWLYALLSDDQKQALFEKAAALVSRDVEAKMGAPWTNFVQRATFRAGVAGAAFGADFPEASPWLEKAYADWKDFHLPAALLTGDGGGWPEGALYSYIVFNNLTRLADVLWTSTDVDIYGDTPWFADRIVWWRFHAWPMPKNFGGRMFYMYHPYGDSERWRAPMQNQEIAAELLVMRYLGDTDTVKEWRWFMHQLGGPIASPGQWELLAYWDETAPVKKPESLSWQCAGTGQVFIRSSWEPTATWIAYQCGPRFTYHQHLDQGAFYIFKTGDLTGENGVYEPHGPSEEEGHLQAYASRASAHNMITIYNPDENFAGYRSGNSPRNNGGQRTWRPYSNTAGSAEYWQKGFDEGAYDTGRITEFRDEGEYVYIASDLTGAYNSARYISGENTSKVDGLTRQLVYFRPQNEGDVEALVIFDRVTTTDPSFETRILFQMANDFHIAGEETKVDDCEYHYDGDFAQTDVGGGRLFMRFVHPEKKKLVKLTAPDKHHLVSGKNYLVPDTPWERDYGYGRLEVLDTADTTEHFFLTVLFPADKSSRKAPVTTCLSGQNTIGVRIRLSDSPPIRTRDVLFAVEGTMGARVTLDDQISDTIVGTMETGYVSRFDFGNVDDMGSASEKGPMNDVVLPGPKVDDVNVTDVTTQAVVTWKTETPTTGYVEFGPDMNMRYLISSSDEPAREHSVRLRGLEPDKTFYVRAAAKGGSPVTGFSEMIALEVPSDDTPPEVFDLGINRVNPTDATLRWSTDDRAEGFVRVGALRFSAPFGVDQRVTLEGLDPETAYTATVTARNGGGLSSEPIEISFTTAAPAEGYFETAFEDGDLSDFDGPDKDLWKVDGGGERGNVLVLENTPRKRTQLVYTGHDYADFTLKCAARTPEGDGNKFRDYAIVFGWQDPENYYAAWFSMSADDSLPGIVRVKDGEWGLIGKRPFKASLSDRSWHEIEVVRRGTKMQAFFDGALAFEADDDTFGAGKIGFGSNNDTAMFDDLKVFPAAALSGAPAEIRTKRLTVEGLVKE